MINLVVALSSEARPLIDLFDMTLRIGTRGFRVYAGETATMVVTGIGKLNAAAGTAYLASLNRAEDEAWLNIGIAGHAEFTAGTGTYAAKITDQATGRKWYPPKVINMPGVGVHITSHDQPVTHYPPFVVCDMEASAYYSIATRFSPGELVQCFKIISDNRDSSIMGLTPVVVENLVVDQLARIGEFTASLTGLSRRLPARDAYAEELIAFNERWHFTVSQKVQLAEALRKIVVRRADEWLQVEFWQHCANARQVLSEMDLRLSSLPVRL